MTQRAPMMQWVTLAFSPTSLQGPMRTPGPTTAPARTTTPSPSTTPGPTTAPRPDPHPGSERSGRIHPSGGRDDALGPAPLGSALPRPVALRLAAPGAAALGALAVLPVARAIESRLKHSEGGARVGREEQGRALRQGPGVAGLGELGQHEAGPRPARREGGVGGFFVEESEVAGAGRGERRKAGDGARRNEARPRLKAEATGQVLKGDRLGRREELLRRQGAGLRESAAGRAGPRSRSFPARR